MHVHHVIMNIISRQSPARAEGRRDIDADNCKRLTYFDQSSFLRIKELQDNNPSVREVQKRNTDQNLSKRDTRQKV